MITFGSLFAGVGGLDLGFERAGLRCAWQVECDDNALSVLARHWPDVLRHDDIHTFPPMPEPLHILERVVGANWADEWKVDVICGGFPCQDLSTAGKQAGLKGGNRSSLFYQMVRVVNGLRPRVLVWENVAGLLSSDGGRDMQRVCSALADIGYFGAWRTLDAQFFGVPQRRRRVFGVFARGCAGVEFAAKVLALAEGVPRHPQEGRKDGEGVASALTASAGRNRDGARIGNARNTNYVAPTLRASGVGTGRIGNTRGQDCLIPLQGATGNRTGWPRDTASCLTAKGGTGRLDFENKTFIAHTLRAEGFDASEDGTGRGTPLVPVPSGVRRLMPVECERLMNWPDDWTRYRADGTELADGVRYRLCGNGVVANVAEWIAKRLRTQLDEKQTG